MFSNLELYNETRQRIMIRNVLLVAVAVLTGVTVKVSGWSLDRRKLLTACCVAIGGGVMGSGRANAACLPGDLSPDCIGVYKVPINDNIRNMVSTKESLKKYAPDLNFVPPIQSPKSSEDALEALLAQRKAADDILGVVASGRLEEAGIKVLNLIPRLTVSGRLLVQTAPVDPTESPVIQELRQQQLVNLFEKAEVAWKNVDILIGQGLRGDLGVSAVAQLQILSELREATAAFDDFATAVQKL
jgi:hypothetical protein